MADEADKNEAQAGAKEHAGPTLLEGFMYEALLLTIAEKAESERLRENLPPMATRALFLATEGIKNLELLEILKPGTIHAEADGRNTKLARYLRSIGRERSQALATLQKQAVDLLLSSRVLKAEVARGWAIMLIFHAAGAAFREARKQHGQLDVNTLRANPAWANDMLNKCFTFVQETVLKGFERTTEAGLRSHGKSLDAELARRFLYFSASEIIRAMDRRIHPMAAYDHLHTVVYPEIEAYSLEDDAQDS